MLKTVLIPGAIAGAIVGIPLFLMTVIMKGHPPMPWGMVIGYLMMLIALSAVFVAVKRHRDHALGGVIRFWPALGLGLAISLIASLIYVLAWEAALAVSGIDFAGDYARTVIEEQKAAGASAQTLQKLEADMAAFSQSYANPLFRLPMTFTEIFPVGALVSLICAGLLRNRRFLPPR